MDSLIWILLIIITGILSYIITSQVKQFKVEQINERIKLTNNLYEQETQKLINERKQRIVELEQEVNSHLMQLEQAIEQESSIIKTVSEQELERARESFSLYIENLDSAYTEAEQNFDRQIAEITDYLNKMKAMKAATIRALVREKELQEKEEFYKIKISKNDLHDISILEDIKPKIQRPDILSKLIWTTYYQKNLTILCNNVIGEQIITGIYKITDCITGLAYIGQSVNIAQRWKDHVKNALGAGSRPGNSKLYEQMGISGIHNFTFELLEETPAAELNEKEKYYIEFYQTAVYGLNTVKGNGQ